MFTIYPAIDLRGGKVVRLKEGDPAQMTSYSDDPAETAKRWLDAGAAWLHVVNLDGAFGESDNVNRAALASILKFGVRVQFGGGMRSLESIEAALSLGVSRAILGTIAIEQPEIVRDALSRFGAEQIAVGIDARDGFVRTRGWKDNSGVPALDLALQMRDVWAGYRYLYRCQPRRFGQRVEHPCDAESYLRRAGWMSSLRVACIRSTM